MNIGDKVRFIHSKGEGIVTKILKNDLVEIETEDGFKTPTLRKALAVVSKIEDKYFTSKDEIHKNEEIKELITSKKGIFLAFLPLNQNRFHLIIINNTDYNLPFCLTIQKEEIIEGVGAGYLESKNSITLKEFDNQNFDSWGTFQFDCFYYRENRLAAVKPFSKRVKFRSQTFDDLKAMIPLMNKTGHVYQLDAEEISAINPAEIVKSMFRDKSEAKIQISEKPTINVDLHIEEIEKRTMNHHQSKPILQIQLEEFEKNLESAIAHGMDEITFIHGVGNGVLREEIHRKLGRHKNVAFFKDAQKDKFGYGATTAKIK